jgi:hypothetical protein
MFRSVRPIRTFAALIALVATALLALGAGTPAGAAPSPTLFLGGGGIAADAGNGGLVVEGPGLVGDKHLRDMLDATVRASWAADDGTLPAVDECEPASATVVVDGERDADLTLVSSGTLCLQRHPNFPSYISLEFRGLHEVVHAKRPQLRGTTGSLSITSRGPGTFTSVYADSFVPTA